MHLIHLSGLLKGFKKIIFLKLSEFFVPGCPPVEKKRQRNKLSWKFGNWVQTYIALEASSLGLAQSLRAVASSSSSLTCAPHHPPSSPSLSSWLLFLSVHIHHQFQRQSFHSLHAQMGMAYDAPGGLLQALQSIRSSEWLCHWYMCSENITFILWRKLGVRTTEDITFKGILQYISLTFYPLPKCK